MNKAIFLDRDGTINVERHYLYKIENFEFLPGTVEGMKMLQDAGYLLIIITNQSGIGRGYYTEKDFNVLNDWMCEALKDKDVEINAVYYCPHHPNAKIEKYRMNCNCRKPKGGLFEKAIADYNIDAQKSWAIGDRYRDVIAALDLGCKGILIGSSENDCEAYSFAYSGHPELFSFSNLYEAACCIVQKDKRLSMVDRGLM